MGAGCVIETSVLKVILMRFDDLNGSDTSFLDQPPSATDRCKAIDLPAPSHRTASHKRFARDLQQFADRHVNALLRLEALSRFYLWPEDPNDPALLELHTPLFQAWFFSCWQIKAAESRIGGVFPADTTIIEYGLQKPLQKLSAARKKWLRACNRAPIQFWQVTQCRAGSGMVLEDMARRRRISIVERKGSHCTQNGDILLAQIIRYQGEHQISACAPLAIPAWRRHQIKRIGAIHSTAQDQSLSDIEHSWRDFYFRVITRRPVVALLDKPRFCKLQIDSECHRLFNHIWAQLCTWGEAGFGPLLIDRTLSLLEDIQINGWMPIQRGRPQIWAAALLYALIQINSGAHKRHDPRIRHRFEALKLNMGTIRKRAAQIRKHCRLVADLPAEYRFARQMGWMSPSPAQRLLPGFALPGNIFKKAGPLVPLPGSIHKTRSRVDSSRQIPLFDLETV